MAELVPQQKRQSIVLALTDHDSDSEGHIQIDATDSNEDLTTDVKNSRFPNAIDIAAQGSEHGTNDGNGGRTAAAAAAAGGGGTIVQIRKEQRVSISGRLKRQKKTAKVIEDRVKQTLQDRQKMIDSIYDEHKDLQKNIHKLEVIARDKAVDDAIRIAEEEQAAKYSEIRKLDKKIKETIDGRQEMIQQLVAEQKQINESIHELEEIITAVSSDRSVGKDFAEVQPLAKICPHPRRQANPADHDQNLDWGRREQGWSHNVDKQLDACSNARFKMQIGRRHDDSKNGRDLKTTTMKRILPMTILRLL